MESTRHIRFIRSNFFWVHLHPLQQDDFKKFGRHLKSNYLLGLQFKIGYGRRTSLRITVGLIVIFVLFANKLKRHWWRGGCSAMPTMRGLGLTESYMLAPDIGYQTSKGRDLPSFGALDEVKPLRHACLFLIMKIMGYNGVPNSSAEISSRG
jgi:hypothetical protein